MDGRLVASLESRNVYPKRDGTPLPLSNHETSTNRLLPRSHFSSAQGLQLIQQSLVYLEFNACPVLYGFAFVYMEDERDAEDAIRRLDRFEFGRTGRRLRVEWTKQERGSSRRLESSRKPLILKASSKTLFVINFDPYNTKTRDLERHFDPYGKILNIRIRRNFGFIQYETQDDATKALEATNSSKLMDRVISVEYAMKDDDDKKPSYGMDRERDRSPRREYGRGRSPSPYARERGSPDYGHGRARRSPSPDGRERASPDYGHRPRVHSRSPNGKGRISDYGRERSPIPRRERDARYSRYLSASPRRERVSLENGRNLSPPRKASPDYPNPVEEKDALSPGEYRRSRSPDDRHAEVDRYGGDESPAPKRSVSRSPPARRRSRS
ncbi:hypothetical protein Leryth_015574 [Lithospermum erythrorhizon]|nr:hypothetical protein Leryth_015574 [Lithospermum erythrorhizon]